jgi:Ca2+-binding EF-hand superfamily protein
MRQGLRERDLRLIFEEMDTDGSGAISFAEFQAKLTKNRHKQGRNVAI